MVNLILLVGIVLFFVFALYDQVGMEKLKGKTQLKVRLKKQGKTDAWIFMGLILLLIFYHQAQISSFTIFLLAMLIALTVYGSFIRSPMLILKSQGFFFGNGYFTYAQIQQINLSEQTLVIDLKTGKRLLVHIENQADIVPVVQFFGGYKTP